MANKSTVDRLRSWPGCDSCILIHPNRANEVQDVGKQTHLVAPHARGLHIALNTQNIQQTPEEAQEAAIQVRQKHCWKPKCADVSKCQPTASAIYTEKGWLPALRPKHQRN